MRVMAVVASLLVTFGAVAAESAQDVAAIKAAVEKLASDDFTEREAANTVLLKMGDGIAATLQQLVTKIEDLEAKQRIRKMLERWPVGGIVWEFEAGYVFGLPVVQDGRVYVGNKDMNFFCLNFEDGKVLWKTPIEGMMYHSPAVAAGRVYVIRTRKNGTPDGTLICLDAKDGSQLWTFHSEDSQTFAAPIVCDGKLFLVNDETLFCLDAAAGTKIWEYRAPKTILSAPSIAGGVVVVGGLDQTLHGIAADTGKPIWEFKAGDSIYAGAALANGRAYAGSNDKSLYCIDLKTGAKLWQYKSEGRIAAAPAYAAGRIYFGGDDGLLICLKAETGEKLWAFNATGMISASPSVSGGRVYAISIFDRMLAHCVNAYDGKPIWNFTTKEAGYATPVLTGRRILLGYHSKFQCVRTGAPGPDEWPMTGGNPARTNCNDRP